LKDIRNEDHLKKLQELAFNSLRYELDSSLDVKQLSSQEKAFLEDSYKRQCVKEMSLDQLIDVTLAKPVITLRKSEINMPLIASYTLNPLGNLVFTRDQQIVTRAGIVMGRLNSIQRSHEVEVMKFCWERLGYQVVGEIPEPFTLEGGDFIPSGRDLCFIGTGLRTDDGAVKYMLEKDLFGTRRVAVVRDIFDRDQDRMHLDCVFNILGYDCCVVLDTIIGETSMQRRLVTEYTRSQNGEYRVTQFDVEFSKYLKDRGFNIIPIPAEYQLAYGCNFVNMGNSKIIAVHEPTKKLIEASGLFHGQIVFVQYNMITNMYGAGHCSTQLFRKRSDLPEQSPRKLPEERGLDPDRRVYFPVSMTSTPRQTTDTVLMIAPTCFSYNIETAMDNAFMKAITKFTKLTVIELQRKVLQEFSSLHLALTQAGVRVHLFTHESYHQTPDAVFPNNWFSTHNNPETATPTLILYPMKAISRRRERRNSLIGHLSTRYQNVVNITTSEYGRKPHFLEGTGSIILDRVNHIAYVLLSERSHEEVCIEWKRATGYELILFRAFDAKGVPIYHTNVALSVGASVAVLCADAIHDDKERNAVLSSLQASGKEVVLISIEQMNNFCANVLELRSAANGASLMAMSTTAFNAFTAEQKQVLLKHVKQLVHANISFIETIGGGSVRCTLAELF